METREIAVISNKLISPASGILRFRKWFDFLAGQVVNITTSDEIPPRMYSIASGEQEEYIELLYRIVPEGVLTPRLEMLKKGSNILVSEAFGKFTAIIKPAWFIATGTGLAPFLSMLRSGYHKDKTLIHGTREQRGFYFEDELRKILEERYIPCYSGGEKNSCFQGRVTTFLEQQQNLPIDIKYYLCGSAEMVVETRQILIDKGIPFQNIQSEIYF